MDGDSPGIGPKKGAGKEANPTRHHKTEARPQVRDSAKVRKPSGLNSLKDALPPQEWESIRWQALTEEGGASAND
jgi:hypothetical protein